MKLIDRLKELEAKATPGPWSIAYIPENEDGSFWRSAGPVRKMNHAESDSMLITEMRNALPQLLAVVDAADQLADIAQLFLAQHGWPSRFEHQHDLDTALVEYRAAKNETSV